MQTTANADGIGFKIRMAIGYLMIAVLFVLPGIVMFAVENWSNESRR